MDHAARLRRYGKKMISKSELGMLYAINTDEELFAVISTLQEIDILQPVKSSLTNGNKRFPIYLKYRIVLPTEDYSFNFAAWNVETLCRWSCGAI